MENKSLPGERKSPIWECFIPLSAENGSSKGVWKNSDDKIEYDYVLEQGNKSHTEYQAVFDFNQASRCINL